MHEGDKKVGVDHKDSSDEPRRAVEAGNFSKIIVQEIPLFNTIQSDPTPHQNNMKIFPKLRFRFNILLSAFVRSSTISRDIYKKKHPQ